MLKRLNVGDSEDMVGFEVQGHLTREDYKEGFIPVLEKARSEGKRLRMLIYFGPEFNGITPGAAWEDFKLGFRHLNTFEKCAVVSDVKWIRGAAEFFAPLMPCPVQVFSGEALEDAKKWLDSTDLGVSHKFDTERGILIVDLNAPITTETIETLRNSVDPWVAEKGFLQGLVIHAKEFPGWKNLGAFLAHFHFVKEHHKRVKKVAFVAGGWLPEVASHVAKYFVDAEIKHFDFNDLDAAKEWASKE